MWVARRLSDALRTVALQDAAAAPSGASAGAGIADPGHGHPNPDPGAADRQHAVDVALRGLRYALVSVVRLPMKLAGPLRASLAALCTVLTARPTLT